MAMPTLELKLEHSTGYEERYKHTGLAQALTRDFSDRWHIWRQVKDGKEVYPYEEWEDREEFGYEEAQYQQKLWLDRCVQKGLMQRKGLLVLRLVNLLRRRK